MQAHFEAKKRAGGAVGLGNAEMLPGEVTDQDFTGQGKAAR
jgi:hypothetical protein